MAQCINVIQRRVHIIYFKSELILQVASVGNLLSCWVRSKKGLSELFIYISIYCIVSHWRKLEFLIRNNFQSHLIFRMSLHHQRQCVGMSSKQTNLSEQFVFSRFSREVHYILLLKETILAKTKSINFIFYSKKKTLKIRKPIK